MDLAEELRALSSLIGPGRDVTIVGHSLGGIIARQALNELALGVGQGIEQFGRVRLVAVDSPWHGYAGPADRGVGRLLMGLARPFMAAGLVDMRAQSAMFQGDPDSRTLAGRTGLLNFQLPSNVLIDLVFAERGNDVLDYSEGLLIELADKLARYYRDETPVRGDVRLRTYWKALLSSSQCFAFQDAMRRRADAGTLDARAVRAALEHYFPKLPGDHAGVLRGEAGRWGLLDYLARNTGVQGLPCAPQLFGYNKGL